MLSTSNGGSSLKRTLRGMVPEPWLREREIFLRLGAAGPAYARLRFLDAMGVRSGNPRTVLPGVRSIVFVCFGNIMRSPMAEALLKHALTARGVEGIVVSSAGIHATSGKEAHPRAQVAAQDLGFSLQEHRAQLLTADMVAAADVVLAMDFQNLAELNTLFPAAKDKFFLLSAYAEGRQRCREIPDPYFGDQDEARRCYALLQTCIQNLVETWPASRTTAPTQQQV